MRTEVHSSEDTTTLYLRWEVVPEGREKALLEKAAGPIVLVVDCERYVDAAGKFQAAAEVDVPIHPHAGERNFGQARFEDPEARRAFLECLQAAVLGPVTSFVHDADLAALPLEGKRIVARAARTPAPRRRVAG